MKKSCFQVCDTILTFLDIARLPMFCLVLESDILLVLDDS